MIIPQLLILIPLLVILLFYGKFILLPFFLSLFIFIIIKSLTNKIEKKLKESFKIKVKKKVSSIIIFLFSVLFFYFLWKLLKFNTTQVFENSNTYQNNLKNFLSYVYKIPIQEIIIPIEDLIKSINFGEIFSGILNSVTELTSFFSLIFLYLVLFAVEEKNFVGKIKLISQKKNTLKIFKKINTDIFNYFQIKSITSFITGIFTFIILFFLGNDLSIFFGILSFFFNFIPVFGSILSIVLPTVFAVIQFLNIFEPLITILLLFIIQIFVGNVIDPRLLGKSLNLSPLIMLIVLSIMGKLWGIIGMFLSVPFLVVILIVSSNLKNGKKVALLISEKGILK